jgi:hypothetical protein
MYAVAYTYASLDCFALLWGAVVTVRAFATSDVESFGNSLRSISRVKKSDAHAADLGARAQDTGTGYSDQVPCDVQFAVCIIPLFTFRPLFRMFECVHVTR